MNAFLTGSHVYGTPHKDSDVDLVIEVDYDTYQKLASLSDVYDPHFPPSVATSLRFGRLNLICPDSPKKLQAWKDGTEALRQRRPVTREEACAEFKQRGTND